MYNNTNTDALLWQHVVAHLCRNKSLHTAAVLPSPSDGMFTIDFASNVAAQKTKKMSLDQFCDFGWNRNRRDVIDGHEPGMRFTTGDRHDDHRGRADETRPLQLWSSDLVELKACWCDARYGWQWFNEIAFVKQSCWYINVCVANNQRFIVALTVK